MANKKDDAEVSVEVMPKTDIKKYLGKKPVADRLSQMLIVLFKGQIKTETEWDLAVKEVLGRKA